MPSVISLMQGAVVALVLEAHLVADQRASGVPNLFRDPRRHAARRQPTRLGMADQAVDAAPQLRADLRQLGGLPEPVSPAITTTWWAAMAALISSRLAAIGELSS